MKLFTKVTLRAKKMHGKLGENKCIRELNFTKKKEKNQTIISTIELSTETI